MKVQIGSRFSAADFCRPETVPASITTMVNRAVAMEEAALAARAGGDARTASKMERRASGLRHRHELMVAARRVSRAQKDALQRRHRVVSRLMDDTQEVLVRLARLRGVDPERLANVLLEEAIYAVEAQPPVDRPCLTDFTLNAAPAGTDAWGTRRAKRIKEVSDEVLAVEAVLARVSTGVSAPAPELRRTHG